MIASYVFGISLWLSGVAITYDHWGVSGLLIGFVFVGFGVVPTAMLASALHSEWSELVGLLVGIVLTFGARSLAIYLLHKIDRDRVPRNHRLVWAAKAYVCLIWLLVVLSCGAALYYNGWEFFTPGSGHFSLIASFVWTMVLMIPGVVMVEIGEHLERKERSRTPVSAV